MLTIKYIFPLLQYNTFDLGHWLHVLSSDELLRRTCAAEAAHACSQEAAEAGEAETHQGAEEADAQEEKAAYHEKTGNGSSKY